MTGVRFSIAWRIILATLLLIVFILVAFIHLITQRIEHVYTQTGEQQKQMYTNVLKLAGKAQSVSMHRLAAKFIKASEFGELAQAIPSIGKEDPKIDALVVFDPKGAPLAFYDAMRPDSKFIMEDKPYFIKGGSKKPLDFKSFPLSGFFVKAGSKETKPPKGSVEGRASFLPKGMDVIRTEIRGKVFTDASGTRHMLFMRPMIEENELVGMIGLVYNLRTLDEYSKKLNAALKVAKKAAVKKIVIFGLIFLLIGGFLAIVQGLRITRPIKLLKDKVTQLASGDLSVRVNIKTKDEIQVLGETFNFLADQLVILLEEAQKKAEQERELEVARQIQEGLIPANPPEVDWIKLAAHFQPASETGGDWWSYYQLKDGRLLLIIGDVTGHGVPAAMITAEVKSTCDTMMIVRDRDVKLDELIWVLNHVIAESGKGQFFMTCFACIFDPANDKLYYTNGGHNFPYLLRDSEFNTLMLPSTRLGDDMNARFEIKEIELKPSDLLIFYTDGIVEQENPDGIEYGEKKMRRTIKKNADKPVEEILQALIDDAEAYYEGLPHEDDHTIVMARYKA